MPPDFLRRPLSPLSWFAAPVFCAILLSSVFGPGGVLALARLRHERGELGDGVFRLIATNDGLRARIRRMRRSDVEVERRARRDLGLVREGEIVYRFPAREAVDDAAKR